MAFDLSMALGWAAALGAVLGLLVGSFLATLTARWPQGRSSLGGRSACDGCGRALTAIELVPLVSFAALGGRCRTCGGSIDRRHPAIEIAAAIVGAAALAVAPNLGGLLGAAFGWTLLTLAILDAEHFWLPDAMTLPLLAAGLLAGLLTPPSLADRAIGAAAGYGGLALIAVGYRAARGRTGLGGGDPKLLAAICAWLGWAALPFVLLLAALLGLGAVALRTAKGERVARTARVPFGAPLAVAAWVMWLLMAGGIVPTSITGA